MPPSELFEIWAPSDRLWSQWAKPVLFTHCAARVIPEGQAVAWPRLDAPNDHITALVIDLPRALAVDYGIAAARDGYWPVPLFNCCFGPGAVLNVIEMLDRLALGTEELRHLSIPPNAPPAFLLDSKRMIPEGVLLPGSFDNRYIILPQDFPSAGFLKTHGITRAVWIYQVIQGYSPRKEPREDLAHVLRRWQEGGIEIYGTELNSGHTDRIDIPRPSRFRSIFYRAFALMGLRRNSAGGFGGIIPQPSSGG
jgi:hypothetical protein